MTSLRLDLLKLTGAKTITSKSGEDFIAIPIKDNNIYVGAKGSYLDLTLMDRRDGPDQYGFTGFAAVDIGKERRLAGEKGPILGNYKPIGASAPAASSPASESGWEKFDAADEVNPLF